MIRRRLANPRTSTGTSRYCLSASNKAGDMIGSIIISEGPSNAKSMQNGNFMRGADPISANKVSTNDDDEITAKYISHI